MGIQGRIRAKQWVGGSKGRMPEPIFLVMPALVALGILLLIFVGKGGDRTRDSAYEDLDGRIKRIEQRLARMEQSPSPVRVDERKREEYTQVLERLEKLERAMKIQDPQPRVRPSEPQERTEPLKKPTPPPGEQPPMVHQVVEGDTLFKISRQYGVTVDEIRLWNSLPPGEGIRTGQKLRIERQGSIIP
jgi:membrane-bound lytic murein transglycosylase D